MHRPTPLELAQQNGASLSLLGLSERRDVMQRWRTRFAQTVKAETGRWVHLGFDWHAFSYQFSQSKGGARGLAFYLAEVPSEVYVIPEDEDEAAFLCRSSKLLDFSDCGTDVHVFPPTFDWTIAFTHEQPDLGPYFSRAEWCTSDAG